MIAQNYKSRLIALISKIEQMQNGYIDETGLIGLKTRTNRCSTKHLTENAIDELDKIKAELRNILSESLTKVQIDFVEIEEPDNSDAEMFKQYLMELKDCKQELSSPLSETRKNITKTLRQTKMHLANEINRQSIIFPSECLDTVLNCPEVQQENGPQWVVAQINEGLNAILQEVDNRIDEAFKFTNEIIGQEIDSFNDEMYSQTINMDFHNSETLSDDLFGKARQSLPALGVGGISMSLISALVNPIAGIISGLAAGGLFAWKSCSSMSKQKRIIEIKKQLTPRITLAMTDLKHHIDQRYEEYEESLSECIETMTKLFDQEMQDCIDALKSCEIEVRNFSERQHSLYGQMNAIENYIKQLDMMMSNPFNQQTI